MPLIDSFAVDHTIMPAPAVRRAKIMRTPRGDEIEVWDLRFYRPNTQMMGDRGLHTLEHLFAGFMRTHVNRPGVEVIDISPMGCKTGFYMSVIGAPAAADVSAAMTAALRDIVALPADAPVPAANPYQCGSYQLHSLAEAQDIARTVLRDPVGVTENEQIALSAERLAALQ